MIQLTKNICILKYIYEVNKRKEAWRVKKRIAIATGSTSFIRVKLNTSKLNFIDSAQSKSFAALTKPRPGSPSSRPSNPLVLFDDWWELRSDWWNNSVSTVFPRLALILFSSVDGNKNDRGKVVVLHLFLWLTPVFI